ncbi:MAG: hypothetical protein LBQ98_06585 [Nitrososphaerota archaeon]|jgi:hypothetical protein|nr:hypothetical protein [Nitrososphaerota archaeon]
MQNKNNLFVKVMMIVLCLSISFVALRVSVAAGYTAETQAAINAGMDWKESSDVSVQRLLMWERYQDRIPTFTFAEFSSASVDIGQCISINMFNYMVPMFATDENDIRYHYQLVVTDPDGIIETLPSSGTFVSDSKGLAYTDYVPAKGGNYSFTVIFQDLYYKWNDTVAMRDYTGVTLLSSNYTCFVWVGDGFVGSASSELNSISVVAVVLVLTCSVICLFFIIFTKRNGSDFLKTL